MGSQPISARFCTNAVSVSTSRSASSDVSNTFIHVSSSLLISLASARGKLAGRYRLQHGRRGHNGVLSCFDRRQQSGDVTSQRKIDWFLRERLCLPV
jgi:hypothetical protein